jgi:sulfatase modifying factor 1
MKVDMPIFLIPLFAVFLVLPASADMQRIDGFAIDRTEVSVGQYRAFVDATGHVTAAERYGGGLVYSAGWERKDGWTWSSPFGTPADPDEPAVHVTFEDASAYCKWAGKRIPSDSEWEKAAFTEYRPDPPPPFITGIKYRSDRQEPDWRELSWRLRPNPGNRL